MSNLILIRHSLPDVRPELPSNHWTLSDEGRRRCEPLAERLREYEIDRLVSSVEPKAAETGRVVSNLLKVPFESVDGLHEHERSVDDFFDNKDEFEAAIARLFANPNALVFGFETANQAHRRFVAAIEGLIERHEGRTLAVVTHGTVMTLFVSRAAGIELFAFWKRLGTPSFAVLSLPQLELIEVAESVV